MSRQGQGGRTGRLQPTPLHGALLVADDFDTLNAQLLNGCLKRQRAVLRGQSDSIAQRLVCDRSDCPGKSTVDWVDIYLVGKPECIAHHHHSDAKADFVMSLLQYLALLEKKPPALDQAASMQD